MSLRARDVVDLLNKCDDSSSIPPTVRKLLVRLAEDNSALKQEIITCAECIDQMSNILMSNTHIIENMKSVVSQIRDNRGKGVGEAPE